ncbi:MAG: 5-(carboxyamino)imidazole ribonucleotide mutase [Clostridia bacterium]
MKVAIIMGSESDFPVVSSAKEILEKFGVEVDVRVISAHRTPEIAFDFAKNAEANGYEVIIGAAGKAAHLPGVLAGITTLPVIGLPIKSSFEDGMDSLLSIVQMPNGVPVATVAVNGALNAGLLAVQMLSIKYDDLKVKFKEYKEEMRQSVIKQDENVKKL